ncbi:MFS transporter [Cellulomonas triticagri]|uniref:MFS transporter n=1 Tax=Cellulomonas triticagri TaxID=2483352 RepID=A0A3M2IN87_9CELL|nr:MFS transporter [Cellulomonas triticagri]RMI03507.1 MFS transporter [Cellulomonas triticagri]
MHADAAPTPAAPAPDPVGRPTGRWPVTAWALWDWGSAAFNAVITTFVFTRWITSESFVDPAVVAEGGDALDAALAEHSTWLGWGLTGAGVLIAVLAPMTGTRADGSGRRRRSLAVQTAVTVAVCAAMVLVRPDPDALTTNLVLGIALLAVANITFELASVHYNALLPRVATPATLGRVSGIGWGAGYVGGIVLLLVLFVGFINPEVGWFGVTGEDGWNIRVAVLLSALWFGVFAIPVLLAVPDEPVAASGRRPARVGVVEAYRRLVADVRDLWRHSRSTVLFLLASAVYRDGLAGVFTFGAVIASGTFGFSASEVVVFAIAANVVAGIATVLAGLLDDRVGPRALIVTSLVGLVVAGVATFALAGAGTNAFWVCGLLLCVFVGPAQSASRSLLTRMTPPGRESQIFGLYATTGRAASFLAPFAFSTFVAVAGSQRWGILGIVLVIAIGLAALLPLSLTAARRTADAA